MRVRFLRLLGSALLVTYGLPLLGQEMDLSTYLDSLKRNNDYLKISQNQVQIAKEEGKIAQAAFLPKLGVSASYQRDLTRSYMYINDAGGLGMFPNKLPMNFYNNFNAALVLEQSIYDPIAQGNLKLARLSQEYADLSNQKLKREIVEQASLLFWQAIFAKQSLQVMIENEKLAKAQWEQVKDLFEEGAVSAFQLKQAHIFYKQSIPQTKNIQRLYFNLLNNLKLLVRFSHDKLFDVKGDLKSAKLNLINAKGINSVLDGNIELNTLSMSKKMALQQVQQRKNAFLPRLSTSLAYTLNASDDKFKLNNENKLAYLQLNLSIPILTGGYNKANLRKAKIEKVNADLAYRAKEEELHKELNHAYNDLALAKEKIDNEAELIRLSEKEIDIATEKIKLGMITNLELKEIRLSFIQAKLNQLNAYLDYQTADLKIKNIIGNSNR